MRCFFGVLQRRPAFAERQFTRPQDAIHSALATVHIMQKAMNEANKYKNLKNIRKRS